jgi:prepilin-type processing-associated H-X9-DG protein
MLMPVFSRAREKAHQISCMSNVRQLALAIMMYAQDNDGIYVQAMSPDNLVRWHGARATDLDPFDPTKGPLWEYLRTSQIKKCSSFAPDPDSQGQFEQGTGGYGFNDQYVGGSPTTYVKDAMYVPAREGQISNPAETVMLTDAAFLDSNGKLMEYSFCEAPMWAFWGAPSDPSTHFRHSGLANVAFCDGHAHSMPMVFTQASGWCRTEAEYKQAHLGFLSKDNSLYDRE